MEYRKTFTIWLNALDKYSEEQFRRKPSPESWSMGQVYTHLLLGNDHFFLKQVEKCLNKEGTALGGRKTLAGSFISLINGFPPVRAKMPKAVEVVPRQPENIDFIRKKWLNSMALAENMKKRLPGCDLAHKTRHPAFGFLNAEEWFRANEMHLRHHFRQKKRLDKFLGM